MLCELYKVIAIVNMKASRLSLGLHRHGEPKRGDNVTR